MLYKIFLLSVIVFCSMAIGNVIVKEKGQRIKTLGQLLNCVKAMRNGMVYQGMTFYEALRHGGRVGLDGFFKTCADIMRSNPELGAGAIFEKAQQMKNQQMESLKSGEMEALRDLMLRLSTALVVEQITDAVAIFNRQITMIMNELVAVQSKKAKVIKSMCLLSGLAVAIILA